MLITLVSTFKKYITSAIHLVGLFTVLSQSKMIDRKVKFGSRCRSCRQMVKCLRWMVFRNEAGRR